MMSPWSNFFPRRWAVTPYSPSPLSIAKLNANTPRYSGRGAEWKFTAATEAARIHSSFMSLGKVLHHIISTAPSFSSNSPSQSA